MRSTKRAFTKVSSTLILRITENRGYPTRVHRMIFLDLPGFALDLCYTATNGIIVELYPQFEEEYLRILQSTRKQEEK
jgi:hypothetical protein